MFDISNLSIHSSFSGISVLLVLYLSKNILNSSFTIQSVEVYFRRVSSFIFEKGMKLSQSKSLRPCSLQICLVRLCQETVFKEYKEYIDLFLELFSTIQTWKYRWTKSQPSTTFGMFIVTQLKNKPQPEANHSNLRVTC